MERKESPSQRAVARALASELGLVESTVRYWLKTKQLAAMLAYHFVQKHEKTLHD